MRNLADFLAAAKEAGFWVYGAAAGAAPAYTAQDYRYPTCFVVGSEGEGLGRRVESLCDVMVSLPLLGPGGVAERERVRGDPAVRGGAAADEAAGGPARGRGRPARRRRVVATMERRRAGRPGRGRAVTVYLIDGYNVLHQFVGHNQWGGRSAGRDAGGGAGRRPPDRGRQACRRRKAGCFGRH